jgi:predicted secreted protein
MLRFEDPTKVIHVAAGESFAIALAGNPTTGYTWQASVDAPSLELVSQEFEPGGQGVGGGGQEVFCFHAHVIGETGISFEYRRLWEGAARDTRRFRVEIG